MRYVTGAEFAGGADINEKGFRTCLEKLAGLSGSDEGWLLRCGFIFATDGG
jgi:hypothetical protein